MRRQSRCGYSEQTRGKLLARGAGLLARPASAPRSSWCDHATARRAAQPRRWRRVRANCAAHTAQAACPGGLHCLPTPFALRRARRFLTLPLRPCAQAAAAPPRPPKMTDGVRPVLAGGSLAFVGRRAALRRSRPAAAASPPTACCGVCALARRRVSRADAAAAVAGCSPLSPLLQTSTRRRRSPKRRRTRRRRRRMPRRVPGRALQLAPPRPAPRSERTPRRCSPAARARARL